MRRTFLLIILSHLFIVSVFSQPKKYKKFQHIMDKATAGHLPGVMIYIRTPGDGEWTGASGLADVERSMPMDKDFVFAVGSIGKTYNAVAAMKLVEAGKFQLDDLMSKYLPDEIILNIPNGKLITIRHLLSNTSGIYN